MNQQYRNIQHEQEEPQFFKASIAHQADVVVMTFGHLF